MILFSFILGTIFGSLANCIVYRLEKGKNFLFSRSVCPKCDHVLGFRDLFPLLSFLFLRGRCRYCREKISFQYFLSEVMMGFVFMAIYVLGRPPIETIFLFLSATILFIVFVYDFKHFLIPDGAIYLGIILTLFYFLTVDTGNLLSHSLFASGAGFFFFIIWAISRGRWMGFGDVLLSFYLGFMLGPLIIPALFSSFLLGAIIGLVAILFKKKTLTSEIPFGPFLVAGWFLALFWGEYFLSFYL